MTIPRLLVSESANISIVVRVASQNEPLTVWKPDGKNHVIVVNGKQETSRLAITDIREIYRIRHLGRSEQSGKKSANVGEVIGTTVVYAPLVPVAIASWPLLSTMGLDEHKNSEDRQKAMLVYQGMTRSELEQAQGKPVEKYLCRRENEPRPTHELWGYRKDQVIRAARYLFFSLDDGKVYFSSFRMPEWMICTALTDLPLPDKKSPLPEQRA